MITIAAVLIALVGGAVVYSLMLRAASREAERRLDQAKVSTVSELQAAATERVLQNEDAARFNGEMERKLRELPIGTRTKYRLSDGSDVWIQIRSERLQNTEGVWGWESLFEDDGSMAFADERRVVASNSLAN